MLGAIITSRTRRLVLEHLIMNPKSEENYAQSISKLLGISYMPVKTELYALEEAGIIKSQKVGCAVVYSMNESCPIFPELRELFIKSRCASRSFDAAPESIKRAVKFVIDSISDSGVVFLFGSRATGENHDRSDWDIGFFQRDAIALDQLLKIKQRVRDIAWPHCIDVVDFDRAAPPLKQTALKEMMLIKNGEDLKWLRGNRSKSKRRSSH